MKLPLNWLKEYVDFDEPIDEFVEKLMWRGFEMASVDPELPGTEGVVVGKVVAITHHENADKLWICQVDVGAQVLTIVTGAQNVTEGALVPVALVGACIGGHIMEPVNMRGVDSYGMLCSGKELGLSEADYPGAETNGILLLREDHLLGQPIAQALGMDDVVFNIELTPNRPDCASVLGMIREAAAALGQTFLEPAIKQVKGSGDEKAYAAVTVENTELCPRYTARVVRDIKIAPSPAWMQKKLRSVGLRPINNIVDITNYVMVEYGHPMHAFDLSCIDGGHIVVRNARENEKVTTLDSKVHDVSPDMLLIADTTKGVGIAGVMGGENSEITENTQTVLFEAAVFKGSNIRSTARKLKNVTDAAARFIKGVEAVNAKLALDRAIELVEELGAGTVVGQTIDVCNTDIADRKVKVSVSHINKLLSLDLSGHEMASMLGTICIPARAILDTLDITVPHYRTDIESGVEADWDIAEEIARIYGYYKIAPTLMRGDTFRGQIAPEFVLEDRIKDTLAGLGAYEMYNYNFTGPSALDALRLPADSEKRQAVKILNPFGEDQSLMRTTLYAGMLNAAALNINRRTEHGRFFEVGNVHFDNNETLPEERKMIGLVVFGNGADFFSVKGILEDLLDRIGLYGLSCRRSTAAYFQPGNAAELLCANGDCIGEFGKVHPAVAKSFGVDADIYMAELSFAAILKNRVETKKFRALPRFPVVLRDVAVTVDKNEEAARLCKVIESAKTDVIVENATLFDVYCGAGILTGKKSCALNFTLRADDHTLSDAEIKGAMEAIIAALEKEGAMLRA